VLAEHVPPTSAQLSAGVPTQDLWHIPGYRYCHEDATCAATRWGLGQGGVGGVLGALGSGLAPGRQCVRLGWYSSVRRGGRAKATG